MDNYAQFALNEFSLCAYIVNILAKHHSITTIKKGKSGSSFNMLQVIFKIRKKTPGFFIPWSLIQLINHYFFKMLSFR